MKPTPIQIKIAKLIESQAKFWQTTNDIYSPTHLCDIEEEIVNELTIDCLISDEQCDELCKILTDLLYFVRNAK